MNDVVGHSAVVKQSEKTICVATPSLGAITETFITNHILSLPFRTCLLHGEFLQYDGNNRAIAHKVTYRLIDRVLSSLMLSDESPLLVRRQMQFLRRERIVAVLAEYGPTGVRIMPACRRAGVPLIVHFHGYDAYMSSVLEANKAKYKELFECVRAIVAVSRDMEEQLGYVQN